MLLLALIRTGAVACPLSTRLPPQGVISLLETAGCRALVSEGDITGPDIEKLEPQTLLADEPEQKWKGPLHLALDQPATIIFTSGSTGKPKAALHTFGNHYYSALGSNRNIPLAPGDRWLLSLPLYHVGGLSIIFRCLLAGATMVLPGPEETIGESVVQHGVTHLSLVATQLKRLIRENFSPENVKAILLGGSEVPGALLEEAASRNLPVRTSYGLTEMTSQVTTTAGSSLAELRTSGRVLPYREVGISEDNEVLVRGETLFAGYVEGGAIERPLDDRGWFHTGDIGSLDGEGYLRILGRKDNMFISGGENVQPEEIEAVMGRLEGVERAVVAPVPDAEFGFRPVAFALGANVEPEKLKESLASLLPRFKIPVAFYGWPEGADPEAAKVDRAFFRERARRMRA